MKTVLTTLLILASVGPAIAQPTVDGQFVVVTNNGTTYSVKIQLKASSAAGLGTTTLQFFYNTTNLSFPTTPVAGTHYSFSSYSGGSYVSTVTHPVPNTVSVNISYNGLTGAGTTLPITFTDVVTINFSTLVPAGSSNLTWSPLIEIYGDDNVTLWTNGVFTPLNTTPLPIQLSSFGATATAGSQVIIRWTTLSEKNNYGFEIQQSLDANKDYQTIPGSFVKGAGTTIQPRSYSCNVANADGKSWYYRLKQMDLDGSVSYSEGVLAGASVKAIPTTMALDQNYPNPFNPTTTIDFALPKDQMVTLEIFNILGQRVALLADGFKEAGYYSLPFDARELSSGLYFYRLATKEQTFLKKMMVVK